MYYKKDFFKQESAWTVLKTSCIGYPAVFYYNYFVL